jgi:hypothetical protein
MALPKQLSETTIKDAPYEVWNAFVGIILSPYDELDPVQRIGHHALWYESELNNGGHLQYFENHGTARIQEVIDALKHIGADCQADVLARAAQRRHSKPRKRIGTVEEYVSTALAGEYDDLDSEFYACKPEICNLLERYLKAHESSFVERVRDV